jgi:hypothetical protein
MFFGRILSRIFLSYGNIQRKRKNKKKSIKEEEAATGGYLVGDHSSQGGQGLSKLDYGHVSSP